MARVTIQQMYASLRRAGADDETARHFIVISHRETGGTLDTSAHNYDPPRDDSWGLYQLNRLAHPEITVACATDLDCSSKEALAMLRRRGNWLDWKGDESRFPEYRQKVNAALSGVNPLLPVSSPPGEDTPPKVTGDPGEPIDPGKARQDDFNRGVKDLLTVMTLELLATLLIGFGLWGIATDSKSAGGAVRSGTRTLTRSLNFAALIKSLGDGTKTVAREAKSASTEVSKRARGVGARGELR